MHVGAGIEQADRLSRPYGAAADDERGDRAALDDERVAAHRNCPPAGDATRNATYSTSTATNAALEYLAARWACQTCVIRPTAMQVTASHAPLPHTSCGRLSSW